MQILYSLLCCCLHAQNNWAIVQQQSFKEDGQKALEAFHQWIQDGAAGAKGWVLEEENHEGWRVSVDEGEGKQGWLLLRASLHDPLLVLNVESDIPKGKLTSFERNCCAGKFLWLFHLKLEYVS